jgi:hypothetical protein
MEQRQMPPVAHEVQIANEHFHDIDEFTAGDASRTLPVIRRAGEDRRETAWRSITDRSPR